MNAASTVKSLIRKILISTSMITSVAAGLIIGLEIAATVVASEPMSAAHGSSLVATPDDHAITAKVQSRLMGERSLKHSDISVTTTNGIVTLAGRTISVNAKLLAESETGRIEGVKSVDNILITPSSGNAAAQTRRTVARTEWVVSDSWISTRVKSKILADSIGKSFDVAVTTSGGVVVLRGTLANRDAVLHMKDIAGKVKGVKGVNTVALVVARA